MLGSVQNVDIKLLKIFVGIYESGGFTQAQTALGLSQANISAKMSKLEGRLGARLCDRGTAGFKLTPEGAIVLEATRNLFSALDVFQETVVDVGTELSGDFNLGLVDNAITNPKSNIDRAISNFIDAAPAVNLNVHIGDPADLESQVLSGSLHCAIGLFNQSNDSLMYKALYQTEHALYCGERHELFYIPDSDIDEAEISAAKFLDRGYLESIEDLKPQLKFMDSEVGSNGNVEGLALLVLSGQYIASLPVHFAKQWVDVGQMRRINVDHGTTLTNVMSIYKKRKTISKVIQQFMAELEATRKN